MNVLDLALSLEIDLEKSYKEQAELNKDNSLNAVFLLLAKEEEIHADILRNHKDKITYELPSSELLNESMNLFKNLGKFKIDIKDIPSQLDSYRTALALEKESLTFYDTLLKDASDEESKKVFGYLLKQEETHCSILEQLIQMLIKPEDWVESAEFGVREDY
ncbi:MAG: rubrerythrin [Clostridiales bacterium]|jgi:rubrerythrin|nr:rubrerythrin [Clostridiales bacterium]